MSRVLAALIAAALAAGVLQPAAAEQAHGLAKTYKMQGRGFGPGDAAYEGTCSFTGDGPAYEVSCFNDATRHTYTGRGLAQGNVLAITIGDRLRGDHGELFAGEYLVLYSRTPDGGFEGIWTDASGAGGRETLTPLD